MYIALQRVSERTIEKVSPKGEVQLAKGKFGNLARTEKDKAVVAVQNGEGLLVDCTAGL